MHRCRVDFLENSYPPTLHLRAFTTPPSSVISPLIPSGKGVLVGINVGQPAPGLPPHWKENISLYCPHSAHRTVGPAASHVRLTPALMNQVSFSLAALLLTLVGVLKFK